MKPGVLHRLPVGAPVASDCNGSDTGRRRLGRERGVTYLTLMLIIVLLGISLTAVGRYWSVTVKRDREAELLFRGNRIKAALEQFAANYEVMKSTRDHRFPLTLEEMTKKPKPTLQQVYKDPITGGDFELLRVNGEIQGVRSRSKGKPLDKVHFKDATTYYDILFKASLSTGQPCAAGLNQFNPLASPAAPPPGTAPSPGLAASAGGTPPPGTQASGSPPQGGQAGCGPGAPGAPGAPGPAGAPNAPGLPGAPGAPGLPGAGTAGAPGTPTGTQSQPTPVGQTDQLGTGSPPTF